MKEIIDRACDIECATEADAKAVAALADLAVQLQSRLDSLEKDAARYRFAKSDKSQGESDILIIHKVWGGDQIYLSGDKADNAIDTAMQANKGE